MIIEVPEWCQIGKYIECQVYNPDYGELKWFKERILSYGYDGFFHQAHNCTIYYSKFSDYGNTIRECESI